MFAPFSTKIAVLDLNNLGKANRTVPAAEAVVEGSPEFTTWHFNRSSDERIASGVWSATPGAWHSRRDGTWEYCTLLEGVVEITENNGPTHRFEAGDTFVLEPGFVGIWRVIEEVRKVWVVCK